MSTNFAAAQERVLERRRIGEQKHSSPYNSSARFQKLPDPARRWAGTGEALWSLISSRQGTRATFRVGQVDAELLDEELLHLLKGEVGEALKYWVSA